MQFIVTLNSKDKGFDNKNILALKDMINEGLLRGKVNLIEANNSQFLSLYEPLALKIDIEAGGVALLSKILEKWALAVLTEDCTLEIEKLEDNDNPTRLKLVIKDSKEISSIILNDSNKNISDASPLAGIRSADSADYDYLSGSRGGGPKALDVDSSKDMQDRDPEL